QSIMCSTQTKRRGWARPFAARWSTQARSECSCSRSAAPASMQGATAKPGPRGRTPGRACRRLRFPRAPICQPTDRPAARRPIRSLVVATSDRRSDGRFVAARAVHRRYARRRVATRTPPPPPRPEPRPAPRRPELVGDGGGLPFSPLALQGPPGPLDPEDPAVSALAAHLATRSGAKRRFRAPWKRGATPRPPTADLDGWRLLARTDGEALFARGRPPQLLTVAVRQEGRRR